MPSSKRRKRNPEDAVRIFRLVFLSTLWLVLLVGGVSDAKAQEAAETPARVSVEIRQRLSDADWTVRYRALSDLRKVPVDEAIRMLLGLRDDPEPRVRAAVARMLGDIGDKSLIGTLREMTADPDEWVARSAKRALGRLQRKEERPADIKEKEGEPSKPLPTTEPKRAEAWKVHTTADGLPDSPVLRLFESDDGAIWCMTRSRGVARFKDETWTRYDMGDGLPANRVIGMANDDRGALWFASSQGVARFDGRTWVRFTSFVGLAKSEVTDVLRRGPFMWFATAGGGISLYDGVEWSSFTVRDGLASDNVVQLHRAYDGSVFAICAADQAGSRLAGINRYSIGKWQSWPAGSLAPTAPVNAIADGAGSVWFATQDGAYAMSQDRFSQIAPVRTYDVLGALDGSVWLATAKGILRLEAGRTDWYDRSKGLPANEVRGLLQDSSGKIWAVTKVGADRSVVAVYDGKKFTVYDEETGLASGNVNDMLEAGDGTVWVASDGGVSRYDPRARPAPAREEAGEQSPPASASQPAKAPR